MATPLADNSVIEVTWWQTFQSQQLLNVVHYWFDLAGGAPAFRPELNEFLQAFEVAGGVNAKMIALCSTGWKLQYVGAQAVTPTRLKTVYREPNTNGAQSGTQAPSNTSIVATKESDFATRWGVGSWHQGGLVQSDVANGTVSAGAQTALSALMDQLQLAITTTSGATYTPIIWSRTVPNRITPWLGSTVQDTVRVMRRRTHRLGI